MNGRKAEEEGEDKKKLRNCLLICMWLKLVSIVYLRLRATYNKNKNTHIPQDPFSYTFLILHSVLIYNFFVRRFSIKFVS